PRERGRPSSCDRYATFPEPDNAAAARGVFPSGATTPEVRMRGRRRIAAVVGAAGIAAAVGSVLAGDDASAPAGAAGRFVVHEWGTFTSVQGADGVALEGLSREEESLPDFVYSRTKVRECPLRDKGWKGLEVPADHVTQKMET